MPNGWPASSSASQTWRPCQPATCTSKASSPEKETRASRAGTPATSPSRQVMNGNAAREMSVSVPAVRSRARALGPATAMVAHCSVTLVQWTRR
jgi:hypothetical protein